MLQDNDSNRGIPEISPSAEPPSASQWRAYPYSMRLPTTMTSDDEIGYPDIATGAVGSSQMFHLSESIATMHISKGDVAVNGDSHLFDTLNIRSRDGDRRIQKLKMKSPLLEPIPEDIDSRLEKLLVTTCVKEMKDNVLSQG
jgi:hypothetical protein